MMNRKAQGALWGLLGIGAAAIGLMVWHAMQPAPAPRTESTPVIALPDLEGRPRQGEEWRGKVVVVNFWATWCGPCVQEVPELIEAQRRWGDQGLQVVGIALDEREPVKAFVERMGIRYPVLIAGTSGFDLSQRFGNDVLSIPFTVVLDRAGQIRYRHLGVIGSSDLEAWIPPLLTEPVAPPPMRQAE